MTNTEAGGLSEHEASKTNGPPVSVVLCTYNGEQFIEIQLTSILVQLGQNDELIIADDGSTDDTPKILTRLLESLVERGIRLTMIPPNPTSRGISSNFARAVAHATNPVVILSDQDDEWLPDRVDLVRREFAGSDGKLLAHSCDARLIDENGSYLGHTQFETVGMRHAEVELLSGPKAFEFLARGNLLPGMTGAFDRNFLLRIGPAPETWPHDYWWFLHAALFDGLRVTADAYVNYRQHTNNTIGAVRPGVTQLVSRFWATPSNAATFNQQFSNFRSSAERFANDDRAQSHLEFAVMKSDFEARRASLPRNILLRAVAVLREIRSGQYSTFSRRGSLRGVHDILHDPRSSAGSEFFNSFDTQERD